VNNFNNNNNNNAIYNALNSPKQQICSQYAVWKRNVFSFFLIRSSAMSGECRLFHVAEPLTKKTWVSVVHADLWNVELETTSRSKAETPGAL